MDKRSASLAFANGRSASACQLPLSLFNISADGFTGANQVTVAVSVIDAGDARPELVVPDIRQWKGGLAA